MSYLIRIQGVSFSWAKDEPTKIFLYNKMRIYNGWN